MVKLEMARIKNRMKRREVYKRVKAEKKKTKKVARQKRVREAEELGEEAPPKQVRKGDGGQPRPRVAAYTAHACLHPHTA